MFIKWLFEKMKKPNFKIPKGIFDAFYVGTLKFSKDEANTYFRMLIYDKFYTKQEFLNIYWPLKTDDYVLNDPNALEKMAENLENDIKGKKPKNALELINILCELCKNVRNANLDNKIFGLMLCVLESFKEEENVVLSALQGIAQFMGEEIERTLAKKTLDVLNPLIDKYKDDKTILVVVVAAIAKVLNVRNYYGYMCYFEKIGGLKSLLSLEEKAPIENQNFAVILLYITYFDDYLERYKEYLNKYASIYKEKKSVENVDEFLKCFGRKETKKVNFENLTTCTENFNLDMNNDFQPYCICLECNNEKSDLTFCKYCLETHHKGHKLIKMFGPMSCDQSKLEELPKKTEHSQNHSQEAALRREDKEDKELIQRELQITVRNQGEEEEYHQETEGYEQEPLNKKQKI